MELQRVRQDLATDDNKEKNTFKWLEQPVFFVCLFFVFVFLPVTCLFTCSVINKMNQVPGSVLGAGNIHSRDHRRGFSDLMDLKITHSFTYPSNQHIENDSQAGP